MFQAGWEQNQVSSSNLKPPRFRVPDIPVFRGQLNHLKTRLVKVNLIGLSIGLWVEHTGDKRIGVGMFVMPLPWLCVIAPRLRNPQIDLVLGVVNRSEVIRHARLNEVPQFGHRLVAQNRVVNRSDIAHVRACLLALNKVNLFFGQITV